MKFQQWLMAQQERSDQIGRLARALAHIDPKKYPQSRRRKPDEHRKWARIVTAEGKPGHIYSFNEAWQEFQKAQQRQAKEA